MILLKINNRKQNYSKYNQKNQKKRKKNLIQMKMLMNFQTIKQMPLNPLKESID